MKAKSYDDVDALVEGKWNGADVMQEIVEAIEARDEDPDATISLSPISPEKAAEAAAADPAFAEQEQDLATDEDEDEGPVTPPERRENPALEALGTPFLPSDERMLAAMVPRDVPTTPTPC